GKDYKYPHDHEGHHVEQVYCPVEKEYYRPADIGYEKIIKERLTLWKRKRKNCGRRS
ncbi:replication-associated recombination protein A, partial [Candidatus Auribacterota bacterium]